MLAAVLLASMFLAQYADWYTTRLGLRLGAFESNPIVATVIDRYGIDNLLWFKLGIGLLLWSYVRRRTTAAVVMIAMFFGAAIWNLHQITKLLPL